MHQESIGRKGPCPECNSSDANHHYPDGHTFCFSCKKYKPAKEVIDMPVIAENNSNIQDSSKNSEFTSIDNRKIISIL